ncbi:hypothetical protein A2U01_0106742, partial [Trifolium medium]|nr:hypothetical protein [Trifolium medium]
DYTPVRRQSETRIADPVQTGPEDEANATVYRRFHG